MDGVSYPQGYKNSNLFTELCEVIVKGILTKRHCKMYQKKFFSIILTSQKTRLNYTLRVVFGKKLNTKNQDEFRQKLRG